MFALHDFIDESPVMPLSRSSLRVSRDTFHQEGGFVRLNVVSSP